MELKKKIFTKSIFILLATCLLNERADGQDFLKPFDFARAIEHYKKYQKAQSFDIRQDSRVRSFFQNFETEFSGIIETVLAKNAIEPRVSDKCSYQWGQLFKDLVSERDMALRGLNKMCRI